MEISGRKWLNEIWPGGTGGMAVMLRQGTYDVYEHKGMGRSLRIEVSAAATPKVGY
jgi:hypothetical protein